MTKKLLIPLVLLMLWRRGTQPPGADLQTTNADLSLRPR